MSTKETVTVRPSRTFREGEIPATLPSVYDAVDGAFGMPNLVKAPLMRDYQRNEALWGIELQDDPEATHVHHATKVFIDAYVYDMEHGNTNWDKKYKELAVLCAQGWLREKIKEGSIQGRTSVFSILDYTNALKEHLQEAEELWGVEWLTSNRPIVGQNDREVEALREYLDEYYDTSISGADFFLNLAGDILINQIRLASTPEQLEQWRITADKFAKTSKRKKK